MRNVLAGPSPDRPMDVFLIVAHCLCAVCICIEVLIVSRAIIVGIVLSCLVSRSLVIVFPHYRFSVFCLIGASCLFFFGDYFPPCYLVFHLVCILLICSLYLALQALSVPH